MGACTSIFNHLLQHSVVCSGSLYFPGSHSCVSSCSVALPTLGGQYPVFSAAPAAKLMEEGKVHTVEHLINPLAMQHPEHTNATAAAATVLPAVSTPPPFQVCNIVLYYSVILMYKRNTFSLNWLLLLLLVYNTYN